MECNFERERKITFEIKIYILKSAIHKAISFNHRVCSHRMALHTVLLQPQYKEQITDYED